MAISDELRALRVTKQIPAKEMAAVVQRLYPKFDKTMLSKCEHGGEYGATIPRDALDALYAAFAPELLEASKWNRRGRHRLTSRISARIEEADYKALQRNIAADGYDTIQSWLADMVSWYNRSKGGLDDV